MVNVKLCGIYSRFCTQIKTKVINTNVSKCMSTEQTAAIPENEYTAVSQYPEIVDPSKEGIKLRERQARYKKIKLMPTVEEKLYELSGQRRHYCHILHATQRMYGIQPFLQHATRTHLIQGLPEQYNAMTEVDPWVEKLRQPFLDCIHIELEHRGRLWRKNEKANILEDIYTQNVIKNIIPVILSAGTMDYEHLETAQVQELPRIDYYWWHGRFYSRDRKKPTTYQTACFQHQWEPAFQIYSDKPLPAYLERDDPLCANVDVPEHPFHPSIWRQDCPSRFLTCVPGYWPGARNEYPLLTFETRFDLLEYRRRNKGETSYVENIVDGIGILGLFGLLGGVASYHGFTPFHELTYPLTSQLVVTDGRIWTFLTYQLNTVCLHPDVDTASHQNICWSSGPMELYQAVEDGQLKDVNDEVLKTLLKFFFRTPAVREGIDMKPYLGEDKRKPEDILSCRAALRKAYDNRLDIGLTRTEVPTWHWVYKKNPVANPSPRVKLW